MSKWIDADHLRKWMLARWEESDPYTDRPFRADEILNQIDRELSIDIVRCRECKYAHMTYGGECKYCDKWSPGDSLYLDGDFFCSYGERKDNEF